MQISLRLAGAATLAAALLLTGCAKKSTDQTTTASTTTTTDASPAAGAAAASPTSGADAAAAAAASATPGAMSVSVSTGAPSGNGAAGFIDLPVYPGAAENKDQEMSMSANGTSVTIKVYSTKDDPKKVADWYKQHLPSVWKGGILTSGDKSVGTFSNETGDGDQSVVIANDDKGVTRIQLSTKHGK